MAARAVNVADHALQNRNDAPAGDARWLQRRPRAARGRRAPRAILIA